MDPNYSSWKLKTTNMLLSLVVLVVVTITVVSAKHIYNVCRVRDSIRFRYVGEGIKDSLTNRLRTYIGALRATRGFFVGSEFVRKSEFSTYAKELKLEKEYPGFQGIGFATRTSEKEMDSLLRRMQEDDFGTPLLVPQQRNEQEIFPITFLYPENERNKKAIGFDMFSDVKRRSAMEQARDSGEAVASERVRLVQDGSNDRPAFLMYLPVYRGRETPPSIEERRKSLVGFVYSPFQIEEFLRGIAGNDTNPNVDFELFDGRTPLYLSRNFHDPLPDDFLPRFRNVSTIQVADRDWKVVFTSRPRFETSVEENSALWILITGGFGTLLLAGSIWLRNRAYQRLSDTELKKTLLLAELEISEDRYRSFIEQSSEGIWRAEVDEPISTVLEVDEQVQAMFESSFLAECNDAMAKMYGYRSASELTGTRMKDLLVPTDEANWEYLRAFVRSGYCLSGAESHEIDQEGNPKYFHNSLVGIIKDGQLVRAWGTQRDITDRKRSEEELNNHRERLQAVIESSDDAIITKSLEGTIRTWNPAAERIFEYSSEEAIGQSIAILIPPERKGEEEYVLQKISRGEKVEQFESERVTKSGKKILVSISTSPMRDASGNIFGASKIARDITEKKLQEDALRESEARYKALAEERNQFLEQERAARSEVEQANRMKDEFLLTLSHELRTPLNAILGWSQLVARKQLNQDQLKEGIAVIERNARSQAQIINDLLDMNRIVSGKMQLDAKDVDLSYVLQSAMDTVMPAARAKELQILVHFDSEITHMTGDPARLTQVFWNILSNAVKYTPRGGKITIEAQQRGFEIEIVISDTGEGIKPEFLPFVFDRFRQADSSTTRRQGGLGLGLSIVRQLVELHGGRVTAQSPSVGGGSIFTVLLPIATAIVRVDGKVEKPLHMDITPSHPSLINLQGINVLVVDDEHDARELMHLVLTEYGAHVLTVSSSKEAMTLLESNSIDLILSDIGMPDEDGYEFIKRVRQLPKEKGAQVPAIAVTAYARREDSEISLEAGFQMHVSKPVEPGKLLAAIQHLVPSQRSSCT